MKPGLWGSRTVKMATDGKDGLLQLKASQEQMRKIRADMPPGQRKRMEATMDPKGDPAVQRVYVSAAMAAKGERAFLPQSSDPGCPEPKRIRNGNRVDFDAACKLSGIAFTMKGETVTTGDLLTTKLESTITDPTGTHTTVVETRTKFIGSDCGGFKSLDQFVKEMPVRLRSALTCRIIHRHCKPCNVPHHVCSAHRHYHSNRRL